MTNSSYERIIEAATRLFALKGYHGMSMRDLAHEVGLSVATVQQHAGSKEKLYQEVFRRQYEEERLIINDCLAVYGTEAEKIPYDAAKLRTFMKEVWKRLIGRFHHSPELVRLWTYRWLESSEMALEIDQKYSLSLYQIEMEAISKAMQVGTIVSDRLDVLIWMSGFAWLQMGFFTGRNLLRDYQTIDPFSPQGMDAFYAFLDRYVDLMVCFNDTDLKKTSI
jgi:AcrR family transcriptional regulator